MRNKNCLFVFVILLIFIVGCGGKSLQLGPSDPLFGYKNDKLYSRYYLWITDDEMRIFKHLATMAEVDGFIQEFWRIRDTDPSTPRNEYKELIDNRMKDVENGVFLKRPEMAGTAFGAEDNLRSDMAHVYLFYGLPDSRCYDCIQRLSSNRGAFVDLMVWYYVDQFNRIRYRFLFYEKYGKIRVFKKYGTILNYDDLLNPGMSPLKEISVKIAPSLEELYEIWLELEQEDPQLIFRTALLEFSSYKDVVIENGKLGKTIGALDPPEPILKIAERLKPTVLGQPGDLSGRAFLYNSYHSFIPGFFRIGFRPGQGSYLLFKHGDLDWEILSDLEAVCLLQLRVSFQNKTTKEINEYLTYIKLAPDPKLLSGLKLTAKEFLEQNKSNYFPALIDALPNMIKEPSPGSFTDLGNELEPGTYIINVDLRHVVTKKSAGGWREEIEIK